MAFQTLGSTTTSLDTSNGKITTSHSGMHLGAIFAIFAQMYFIHQLSPASYPLMFQDSELHTRSEERRCKQSHPQGSQRLG